LTHLRENGCWDDEGDIADTREKGRKVNAREKKSPSFARKRGWLAKERTPSRQEKGRNHAKKRKTSTYPQRDVERKIFLERKRWPEREEKSAVGGEKNKKCRKKKL